MSEISAINKGIKPNIKMKELSSKSHASLEVQGNREVHLTEIQGLQEFKDEMEQAVSLVHEIHGKLQRAYQDLAPPE